MHLIECDACKATSIFYAGKSAKELDSRGPDGWGWKAAYFKGGSHWGDRELLIHACNIKCAVPAVARLKAALPGVKLDVDGGYRRDPVYPPWQGFASATQAEWAELRKVPLADGGEPPAVPKKNKGGKYKLDSTLPSPSPTFVSWAAANFGSAMEGTVPPMQGETFPVAVDPVPLGDDGPATEVE